MTLTEHRDLLEQLSALAASDADAGELRGWLSELHPSDIAELMGELGDDAALRVFAALDDDSAPEVLDKLDEHTAAVLHDHLPSAQIVALLDDLAPDEAAEVVAEAGPDHAAELMAGLTARDPEDAAEVRELLAYAEGSAGRLMTRDYFSVRPEITAGTALDLIRRAAEDAETVYIVYVTAAEGRSQRLLGVISLRELLVADPAAPVGSLMLDEPVHVEVDTPQADVAHTISKYDLLAVPVLDRAGRLAGIVTVDDALDVMVEEFDEQLARITGSDAAKMARRSAWEAAKLRIPWLLGTMAIELCSGMVIAKFNWVLKEVILLTSFMPVISAVSGNTGLQAAAIAVRGLETGHVTRIRRILPKELLTSFLIASVVGTAAALIGWLWSHHLRFGLVIGGGMFFSMQVAGFMGTAIPVISKRLGFDPASTAGPFETAFQDVIGFGVFLWLASLCVKWLQ
jgi:magnesium transporter